MNSIKEQIWHWQQWEVAWNQASENSCSTVAPSVLIHGFGACKEHWRNNQPILGKISQCYAIDLIGFGGSSQPKSQLTDEPQSPKQFHYCFDSWARQVADFCRDVVKQPTFLIGNSIGAVVALRAAQILQEECIGLVLIDCAQRQMDDKRLNEQANWMRWTRPYLKSLVRQRWLSKSLFRNAANKSIIKKILKQAYPSGKNIDEDLVNLLLKPSKREGASEAFRGFINLFNDHLAPDLMTNINVPVDLIWGEKDPWEPIEEAQNWMQSIPCIRSLTSVTNAGHCPHDEEPNSVNEILIKILQETK